MPEEIVIWEGEEWRLLSFREMIEVRDEEILIYDPNFIASSRIELCSYWDGRQLRYKKNTYRAGCFFTPNMWERGSFFLPYRRVKGVDITKCYCKGPAINKFCFDTQRVEVVCCRCKKRKGG